MLEREYATYQLLLPELLASKPGQFALIHGDVLIGTYGSYLEASQRGYRDCQLSAFLVKEIAPETTPPPMQALFTAHPPELPCQA